MRTLNMLALAACLAAAGAIAAKNSHGRGALHLLNASYAPTRALFRDINPAFLAAFRAQTGVDADIVQSHAGSAFQARQVASGAQEADVVTLGSPSDIEGLSRRGLIGEDWRERLPNQARPYYATIVFVVRKGNPRQIRDWPDLVRDGVEIVIPDPGTSANGKAAALAAWGAVATRGGDDKRAREFVKKVFAHAASRPAAAREAGIVFVEQKQGDVQLAWENEALREAEEHETVEVVYPPVSLRAEPSVAWVDVNVARHGSAFVARAYLEFLFSDIAQDMIARRGFRPVNEAILKAHADRLRPIALFSIDALAQNWLDAQQKFFGEGGVIATLDQPGSHPK